MFKKNYKKFVLFVYALVLISGSIVSLLPHKAAAADYDSPSVPFCVPEIGSDTKVANHFYAKGWLTISVIDRAHLKLSYTPTGGNCQSPSDLSDQYITPYKNRTWTDVIEADDNGVMKDDKLGDGVLYQATRGSDGDDTRVDLFNRNGGGGNWPGNGYAWLADSTIAQKVNYMELTMGFEEDDVNLGKDICEGKTNGNVVFSSFNGTDHKLVWWCDDSDGIGGGHDGIVLHEVAGEGFDPNTLANFNITYTVSGSDTDAKITAVAESDAKDSKHVFIWCPGRNSGNGEFRNDNCSGDSILTGSGGNPITTSDIDNLGSNVQEFYVKTDGGDSYGIGVAGASNDASQLTNDPGSSSGDGGAAPTLSCHAGWNPLNWLVCAAVNGMVSITSGLENIIDSQLSVGTPGNKDTNPNEIFCDRTTSSNGNALEACQAYHKAWNSVRLIALGLMVIAGLVIIIAQALGMEILDAYTIRKVLPRLLASAILITLSWQLMDFFVTLTNSLGYGVRWLIYEPFTTAGISSSQISLGGGGQVLVNILGFGALAALGIFGLLSFAATAALAVFIAFLVLVIRQLLLIVLIIFAPVALVAFILPNTKKLFDTWWDFFAKALLMFPLITAFIAAGRVFAVVSTQENDNTIGQFIGFAAYVAPYFLLPLTFRFAGGALRNIGGFVNDRGRGGFDRLRKYRQGQASKNFAAMKEGNRIKASNVAARAFNKTTRGVANIPSAGYNPLKMRSRFQQGQAQHTLSNMAEYMEKSQAWKYIQGNDDYLQATMKNMGGGDTEDDWRRYLGNVGYKGRSLEQGVAAIRAAKRDTNDHTFKAAAVVANSSTGTGWKEGGAGQMMESINEAAGGDRDLAANMLAQMRGRATQARRMDLAGSGFGGQLVAMNSMYSSEYSDNGRKMTVGEASDRMHQNALFTQGPGALIGARGDTIKLLAPQMVKKLQDAHDKVTTAATPEARTEAMRELKQEYATLAGRYDAMSYASPENAQIMADSVLNTAVTGDATVRQMMESFRGDSDFLEMRRELGRAEADAYSRGAGATGSTGAAPPPVIPSGG